MKWGKFEIESSMILFLAMIIGVFCILHSIAQLDLEKEKTKQLELQKDIEYIQQKEGNKDV